LRCGSPRRQPRLCPQYSAMGPRRAASREVYAATGAGRNASTHRVDRLARQWRAYANLANEILANKEVGQIARLQRQAGRMTPVGLLRQTHAPQVQPALAAEQSQQPEQFRCLRLREVLSARSDQQKSDGRTVRLPSDAAVRMQDAVELCFVVA